MATFLSFFVCVGHGMSLADLLSKRSIIIHHIKVIYWDRWDEIMLNFHRWLAGGVVLEVKRSVENFPFLGKNANTWHPLLYHSISVTNGITKTTKYLGKRKFRPMYLCKRFLLYNCPPFSLPISVLRLHCYLSKTRRLPWCTVYTAKIAARGGGGSKSGGKPSCCSWAPWCNPNWCTLM